MVEQGMCPESAADQLMAAEIDAEFDHANPVVENLARVREGDLIVSDMYLPAEVIRRLLHHIGLRTFVHIVVTNGGKRNGTVWPALCRRWLIQGHLGDNLQADVEQPIRHGITAEHYPGTAPSDAERVLIDHQLPSLAGIARALRLRNPYPAGSAEQHLWLCYSQLNFPLLCLAAMTIRRLQLSHGRSRVIFSARDGYFLSEVFSNLYPTVPSHYLHVSRRALKDSSTAVAKQLDAHQTNNAVVVDLASTGNSWFRFAEAESRAIDFFSLVRIAPYTPAHVTEAEITDSQWLQFSSLIDSRRLESYSNAIEVLNTAPYGSTQRLTDTGDIVAPELESGHELPGPAVASLVNCHTAALDLLRKERSRLLEEVPSANGSALGEVLVRGMTRQALLNELGARLSP